MEVLELISVMRLHGRSVSLSHLYSGDFTLPLNLGVVAHMNHLDLSICSLFGMDISCKLNMSPFS